MLTAAPCARTTRPCARIAPAPTWTSPRTTAEPGDLGLGLVNEKLVEAHAAAPSFWPFGQLATPRQLNCGMALFTLLDG